MRIFLTLVLLLATVSVLAPVPATPVLADTSAPFSVNPTTLDVTLALGQQDSYILQLSNTSSLEQQARLYEALPAMPQTARLSALPAALREVALPQQTERVDPRLQDELAEDDSSEFLVFLADRPDLSAAYAISDWNERGAYVYQTLTRHAERSQRDLRAWLEDRGLPYQSLWIANAIAVRGSADDAQTLASRADVAMLRANYAAQIEAPASATSSQINGCDETGRCWNIERIGAYRVWEDFGITGNGIAVANIDSGVNYAHPALLETYRGHADNGSVDHNYNWYDPIDLSTAPKDSIGHGTHTMGTMAASGDGVSLPAVGVAPGVRWLAARGCAVSTCDDIDLMLSAQWLLAPTDLRGQNPRPDLRPHVVNNSWAEADGNNDWYSGYTAAWHAAGIFPLFAAGNGFSVTCGTIASPADYPDVVGVGATGRNDEIAGFSKRGPTADGRIKPDLVAPGEQVPSTIRDGYGLNSGTSMATPHVAGVVALILAANPELIGNYAAIYDIVTRSASPRPDSRCGTSLAYDQRIINQVYGYGRLDAYAAVAQASVDVPWLSLPPAPAPVAIGATQDLAVTIDASRVPGPGSYSARLLIHTDTLTDQPLVVPITLRVPPDASHSRVSGRITSSDGITGLAATITVQDGPTVRAAIDGSYSVTLPGSQAEYQFEAAAIGYQAAVRNLTVSPAMSSTLDFALDPATATLAVDTALRSTQLDFGAEQDFAITLHNTGNSPLVYTSAEANQRFAVLRSDQPGGPPATPFAVPSDAVRLNLAADQLSTELPLGFAFPYLFGSYEGVFVSANGWLSFDDSGVIPRFYQGCLPASNANNMIVPLQVDLDPAQGGTVHYANISEGFLLDFDAVALADNPAQRLSFQVLLTPDGHIVFNYRDLGNVQQISSIGVQQMPQFAQTLGCGIDILPATPLRIELRPQPVAPDLFKLEQTAPQTVAPGASVTLTLTLRWQHQSVQQPLDSALLISSNDIAQPLVWVPLRLTSNPAPLNLWFPVVGHE